MAGGMTPSRRSTPTSHGTSDFGAARHRPLAQHVWVGTLPCPGVLLEWRRQGEFWLAQVAYVDAGRLIVAWLPSDMVRPLLHD